MTSSKKTGAATKVAIVWDSYGPQHVDRVNALVGAFDTVLGVELFGKSHEYNWSLIPAARYDAITVTPARRSPFKDFWAVVTAMVSLRLKTGIRDWVVCNYERPYVSVSTILLRLTGARVFIMQDSKYVDRPRNAWREALKSFAYAPYNGALSSSPGTTSYLRFLGMKGPIAEGFNTSSIERLRSYAVAEPPAFADRPFLFVGRFIWEKNAPGFVASYADYVAAAGSSARKLVIIGAGPQEDQVRAIIETRGLSNLIEIIPWADASTVIAHMSRALYLFMPSVSETFGNVVGEAASVGLPSIVSEQCGVRDVITRDFISGFTLPADKPEVWTQAMLRIAQDEPLWKHLSEGARIHSDPFDVSHFRAAILKLVQGTAAAG